MSLNLQEKKTIVTEVNDVIKDALSVVVADFRGVSVERMTKLRKSCHESGVYVRIIRNTLVRRVVEGTNFECLKNVFIGPTLIACSKVHPGSAARLLKEFNKYNPSFKIKAGSFEGKLITAKEIDNLAVIPTYEEAIIRLMSVMKEVSIGRLMRIMLRLRDQKKVS
ncbi:50S ribosomal protein L10 [Candidatus Arsenophonus lipoptenae]|uniref:Large ribosomal subunit protein uL10 n=1 Tax=Candidatus Arsenophonus lipoptenae TaxID=634113 RepID=A0A0X9VYW0_9GAMM|nr:50S ribosomal protein L10 [Candidatus Arsenophonus lipoptenae]AMA64865.1 50S ribosomal protein L10 [Candidatus Arsenophonus lipoptenae]